jgi:hypothetical protein
VLEETRLGRSIRGFACGQNLKGSNASKYQFRYEGAPVRVTPGKDLLVIRLLKAKDNTARWKAAHSCRKTAAPIASGANNKSDAENPRRRSIAHDLPAYIRPLSFVLSIVLRSPGRLPAIAITDWIYILMIPALTK